MKSRDWPVLRRDGLNVRRIIVVDDLTAIIGDVVLSPVSYIRARVIGSSLVAPNT